MRGQGRVFQPTYRDEKTGAKRSVEVWWLDYTVGGKRHREPTEAASKREAQQILRQRIGERKAGKVTGRPDKVTFAQMRELVERQYALDERRSLDRVKAAFAHLEEFFGKEARAPEITTARLDAFAEKRLAAGRKRSSVNYELATMRRAFRLAIEKGLLATMPVIKLPRVRNARSGFFEDGEFALVLLEQPADVRDLIEFLRATGWRRDEGRLLSWSTVDRDGGTIRLEETRSKSGRARVFPYALSPTLKSLIEARWEQRDGLYVFHREGKALGVGAVRSAWKRACVRAGLATVDPATKKVTVHRIVHDLRRSAARDFRRAGVSEGEIMRLCG